MEAARKPHVVLLGGQDTPTTRALRERWKRSMSSILPRHDLTVVEWPNPYTGRTEGTFERLEVEPTHERASSRRYRSSRGLDGLSARAASALIAGLDKLVRFDDRGRPRSVLGRGIYHYTRFSVDALYNRGALGDDLVRLLTRVLSGSPVDLVVAHSFGGTIAKRAAWELQERHARFSLITLGTASGYTVERAQMFAPYRSARGIERSKHILSWKHFYSKSDAFVGHGQMPRSFLGVELVEVHTGPFWQRGFGHALGGYLAAPRVRETIVEQLTSRRRGADATHSDNGSDATGSGGLSLSAALKCLRA